MIVALHVAIGAATGGITRSRSKAIVIGPVLHIAGDHVPHRHPVHSAWEYLTGALAIGLVVKKRGAFDAATVGAAAAVLPDLEHLAPVLRIRGAKLFHRRRRADRRGSGSGLSALAQTLLAAVIITPVLLDHRRGHGHGDEAHSEPVSAADPEIDLDPTEAPRSDSSSASDLSSD